MAMGNSTSVDLFHRQYRKDSTALFNGRSIVYAQFDRLAAPLSTHPHQLLRNFRRGSCHYWTNNTAVTADFREFVEMIENTKNLLAGRA
jgi:hypothetical protein